MADSDWHWEANKYGYMVKVWHKPKERDSDMTPKDVQSVVERAFVKTKPKPKPIDGDGQLSLEGFL